jgi:hypothetical protein
LDDRTRLLNVFGKGSGVDGYVLIAIGQDLEIYFDLITLCLNEWCTEQQEKDQASLHRIRIGVDLLYGIPFGLSVIPVSPWHPGAERALRFSRFVGPRWP